MTAETVRRNFPAFMKEVSERSLRAPAAENQQRAMDLLYLAIYSPVSRIGEVDFKSFAIDDGNRAFDQLYMYEADDISDDSEEDVDHNKQNLITEINRVQHAANIATSLKAQKTQRRFF